jgi:hypothetical protein
VDGSVELILKSLWIIPQAFFIAVDPTFRGHPEFFEEQQAGGNLGAG